MSSSIPSIAGDSAYQQALLAQQVQIAALAKANETARSQGEAVLALLESAMEVSAALNDAAAGHLNVVA